MLVLKESMGKRNMKVKAVKNYELRTENHSQEYIEKSWGKRDHFYLHHNIVKSPRH